MWSYWQLLFCEVVDCQFCELLICRSSSKMVSFEFWWAFNKSLMQLLVIFAVLQLISFMIFEIDKHQDTI